MEFLLSGRPRRRIMSALVASRTSPYVPPASMISKILRTTRASRSLITSRLLRVPGMGSRSNPNGGRPPVCQALRAFSVNPFMVSFARFALKYCARASSRPSNISPSGVWSMRCEAYSRRIPHFFRRYLLWTAESYRSRANRSTLSMMSTSKSPALASASICRNCGRWSVLPLIASSAYTLTLTTV